MTTSRSEIVLAGSAEATSVGLVLPDGLSYDDWREVGSKLTRIDHAVRWWWGDWLNYGHGRYEQGQYQEAEETSGLEYQSLADCKWVAGAIKFSRRRENLTWAHHREVAGLEPDEQDMWLDRAAAEGWNRNKLRAAIKGPNPLPPVSVDGEAPVGPLLRFCLPDWSTSAIVRAIVLTLFPDAATCLDPTYGSGLFWSDPLPLKVVAHDLDATRALDGVLDVTDMSEAYNDATFDLVVFDPPHLADGGAESVMAERFGTVETQDELEKLVIDGARECWRVCEKGIIVKIADYVHGQVFNDMCLVVCDALGQWPYEKVHQVRGHSFIDQDRVIGQYSAYNNGATYLIFRKGSQRHVARTKST